MPEVRILRTKVEDLKPLICWKIHFMFESRRYYMTYIDYFDTYRLYELALIAYLASS